MFLQSCLNSPPVSQMYSAPQFLHGIWYTSSPCSSSSTLSLGCTNRRLMVVFLLVPVCDFFLYTLDFTLPSSFLVNFASKKGMLLFSSSFRVKMMLHCSYVVVNSLPFLCVPGNLHDPHIWEGVKIVDKEPNRRIQHIKEAIWIRKARTPINRDEGNYELSHVYDDVIQRTQY